MAELAPSLAHKSSTLKAHDVLIGAVSAVDRAIPSVLAEVEAKTSSPAEQ